MTLTKSLILNRFILLGKKEELSRAERCELFFTFAATFGAKLPVAEDHFPRESLF